MNPKKHQAKKKPIIYCSGEGGEEWLGWPEGVRASGTLSAGAAGGQYGHAERSEASRGPS